MAEAQRQQVELLSNWQEYAACKEMDTDTFFPAVYKPSTTKEPLETCAVCPVAEECLEYAIVNDERFGIWGGTTERQRYRKFIRHRRINDGS